MVVCFPFRLGFAWLSLRGGGLFLEEAGFQTPGLASWLHRTAADGGADVPNQTRGMTLYCFPVLSTVQDVGEQFRGFWPFSLSQHYLTVSVAESPRWTSSMGV